jgi:hypothetical protein
MKISVTIDGVTSETEMEDTVARFPKADGTFANGCVRRPLVELAVSSLMSNVLDTHRRLSLQDSDRKRYKEAAESK